MAFGLSLLLAACTGDLLVFSQTGGSGGDQAQTNQTASVGNGLSTATTGPDASVGSGDTAGVGGAAGNATVGSGGDPSSTATSTSVATSVATSTSVAATTATSSSTGGGNTCSHDPCTTGQALDANCSSCVTQICQYDPYCCSQNGNWDLICSYFVDSVCKQTCPSGPNLPDCNSLYGGAQNYQLCYESANTCEFGMQTQNGPSCGEACAKGGGECVGMVDDINNQACNKQNSIPNAGQCGNSSFASAVCICTRGCGGGPACTGGMACSQGSCQ